MFFDARFDVSSVTELEKKLARLPRPVENEVRKSNRTWAAKLRDLIRAEAAMTFGARAKTGPKHKTRPGAWAKSVRSKASGRNAHVYGGGTASAPHWAVQEYGGSVFWRNARGKGHSIPIGNRVNVSSNRSGNRHGAEGKVFWPTVNDHAEDIARYITEDAIKIVHDMLSQG